MTQQANAQQQSVAPKETPPKQQLRLWLKLLSSTTHIEKTIRNRLSVSFGTTLPQFDFLAALEHAGCELTMGNLSHHLMVSNGNVTGVADRLERNGLIRRTSPSTDRRISYVGLTNKGRDEFREMAAEHERWINEVMCCLDEEETYALIALLDKIRNHLNSNVTETQPNEDE